MYRAAILNAKFQRDQISTQISLTPKIVEGRWYGELKRTKKFGNGYDWKTRLNCMVVDQISTRNKDTHVIDKLIKMFDSKIMFTLDVLDLIDSALSNGSTMFTQIPSTGSKTEMLNELSIELFDNFDNFFDL